MDTDILILNFACYISIALGVTANAVDKKVKIAFSFVKSESIHLTLVRYPPEKKVFPFANIKAQEEVTSSCSKDHRIVKISQVRDVKILPVLDDFKFTNLAATTHIISVLLGINYNSWSKIWSDTCFLSIEHDFITFYQ